MASLCFSVRSSSSCTVGEKMTEKSGSKLKGVWFRLNQTLRNQSIVDKNMFVAKSFICYEIISNQRQISCLAGFNWMSNESVGCLTCGNIHLETTCVNTYLTEVHKGCCWGGADLTNTRKLLYKIKNVFNVEQFLCKWAWCENHEKPIGLFFVFVFFFASINIKILRLLVVEVPSSHRTMWLDSCKDQVFIRDYWSSYE